MKNKSLYYSLLLLLLAILVVVFLPSCTIYTYPFHESKCGYQKIKTR